MSFPGMAHGVCANVTRSPDNAYVGGNVTRMKLILPVGKERAWNWIASAGGLASWLPIRCKGHVARGEPLEFLWPDGTSETVRVLRLGAKRSSFALRRGSGEEVRFFLHGRRTTLTLEVEYPKTARGRADQIRELPQWSFRLANLKAVALGGLDLRNRTPGRAWSAGFID